MEPQHGELPFCHVAKSLDRRHNLLVEERIVLHRRVVAVLAVALQDAKVQLFAVALGAFVVRLRVDLEESHE